MGFFRYNLEVKAVKLYTNNQKKRIREIPQKERADFYKWYRAFFPSNVERATTIQKGAKK